MIVRLANVSAYLGMLLDYRSKERPITNKQPYIDAFFAMIVDHLTD